VSSATRWTGKSASPGSTEARYSRTGSAKRRQVSTIERMLATRGPASLLPMWIQFFLLCTCVHNRKNWLFFGDADAGQRGAILYTIIESCRRRGVEAYAYLRDVLSRLPHLTNWQIKDVTPKTWAKSTTAPRPKAA